MTEEIIKQLEARIEKLEFEVKALNEELDEKEREEVNVAKMARAICEMQEEMMRNNSSVYIINRINAPTRVGMN